MLFPSRKFPFCRPKTNFGGFVKEKAKRKKGSSPPIFNFPPSLFRFSFFSSPFPPPLFLASLIQVGQQNFPAEKCQGPLCPPAPTTVTPLPMGLKCLIDDHILLKTFILVLLSLLLLSSQGINWRCFKNRLKAPYNFTYKHNEK